MSKFDDWFKRATGRTRFPYQRRFAEDVEIPNLAHLPTGLGKRAMAVLYGRGVGQKGLRKGGFEWLETA